MTTQHTPYLLKVLSGSNAGALVRLKVGDTTIGKSMTSDIILHDEHIADAHVKLEVEPEQLTLEAFASPVLIDNRELPAGSRQILQPYQVISLGSIDFFIADVRKPGRRQTELPPKTSPKPLESVTTNHAPKSKANYARRPTAIAKPVPPSKYNWLWLGAGALLLISANFMFLRPQFSQLAESVGLKEAPLKRAELLVQSLPNEQLKVVEDSKGQVIVEGYVQSRDDRRLLMNQALISGGGINYRIWVRDDLVANATQVARAFGQSDLRFSNGPQGQLIAQGYISGENDWAQIKSNIMNDVSGIQAIDDSAVQTLQSRKDALVQFIDKKGLSSRVKVTIEQGRIKVDGELTETELALWSDLYAEFVAQQGQGPAIVENLFNVRDRLKLVIRSVSVGDTPFLVSKDGKKYMEGSSLGNDYFIKKITPDHVLLSNNGIEIPIYYGVGDK